MPETLRTALPASSRLDGASRAASGRADWSVYATAYDLMCESNPAYQELLTRFAAFLETIEAPGDIIDIGGGTGNFTLLAADAFPDSRIRLLEPDQGMVERARRKLPSHVQVDRRPLEALDEAASADLLICVHALYAMPDQAERLADMRRLLRPGGHLFLIDLGRELDIGGWRSFIFRHLVRRDGLFGALRTLWRGREVATQNKLIREAQQAGLYWTYESGELAERAGAAGFAIERRETVYRGFSDLLVCRAVN